MHRLCRFAILFKACLQKLNRFFEYIADWQKRIDGGDCFEGRGRSWSVFIKDPAEYSMAVLRRWLECHGQKKGGRKQDLMDRVRGCIVIKTKVDPKIDGGKWYSFKKQSSSQSTASSTASAVSSSMAAASS